MGLPVQSIVETLRDAGFTLSLAPAGGLAVKPASKLTPELRDIIRTGKVELVRWFTQSPANEIELPPDPSTWRELAAAYHAHHFACVTCQAAGRGKQYGLRCGTGSALWTAYQTVI
jgi:hypothetical protein